MTLGCLLLAGGALATNLTVSPSSAVTSSQRTFTKCWITAIHIRNKKYIHSIAEMLLRQVACMGALTATYIARWQYRRIGRAVLWWALRSNQITNI